MSFSVTKTVNVIIAGSTVQLPVDKQSQEIAFDAANNAEIIEGTIVIGTAVATLVAQVNGGTISVASVLSPVTVQGTVIVGTIQVPEIVNVATISNAPLITVQGNVNVGTIANSPLITVQGAVSASITNAISVATIQNAPLVTVQGNVNVATISNAPLITVSTIPYVGTIANSPLITVGTILNAPQVTVGTILNPVVVATILTPSQVINNQNFIQTNILTNATITTSGAATLTAGAFQDLVVDVVYGTVISGSIQTVIMGVEPQSGIQTSTIVAGAWFAGTIVTGQRLVATGPLGALVAVVWNVPAASTITGVFITAEQSTSL